jgi:phosphoribosylamine-glycine ligase
MPNFKGIFSIKVGIAAHLSPRLSVTVLRRSFSFGDLEAQTILPILGTDLGILMHACLGSGDQFKSMTIETNGQSSVSINVRIKPFNTDVNDHEGAVTERDIRYLVSRKEALLKYGISMTAVTCGVNFPEGLSPNP